MVNMNNMTINNKIIILSRWDFGIRSP